MLGRQSYHFYLKFDFGCAVARSEAYHHRVPSAVHRSPVTHCTRGLRGRRRGAAVGRGGHRPAPRRPRRRTGRPAGGGGRRHRRGAAADAGGLQVWRGQPTSIVAVLPKVNPWIPPPGFGTPLCSSTTVVLTLFFKVIFLGGEFLLCILF